ncbi:hypothetical protein [Actinomadura chokoriensis]|uniref:hypothetical protein n=1 Tax=Actinomadura chokoriensis TaxID=454156 RepID=UPI0031F9726D
MWTRCSGLSSTPRWRRSSAVLIAHPEALTAASEPPPARPPLGGRTLADAGLAVLVAVPCGLLPAVALPFVRGRGGAVPGALLQAGLIALGWFAGLGPFLVGAGVLQVLSAMVLFGSCGEDRARTLARTLHRRYYVQDDFAGAALKYMKRAQRAVSAVLESEVDHAGLLDEIANAVTLPQQEWDIAQTCAELTRLKRELREVRDGDPALTELLEPQWRALKLSAEAVERRVAALEQYAAGAAAADAAYRKWKALEELDRIGDDVRELLARSVRDELGAAEIERLAAASPLAELRRRVDEAKRAGLVLAAGEKEPV